MASNINYTNLTIDDLMNSLRSELLADERFKNARESSTFIKLVELFASIQDLNNYYIQRRSEESFLDTAKLKSSAILLARMLGYAPQRPEPANTSINIKISGPLPEGLNSGDILYFPKRSTFTFNNLPYILKYTYKYEFTDNDISQGTSPDWSKTITGAFASDSTNYDLIISATSVSASLVVAIELLQGELKNYTINGTDTDLVGMIFQKYRIPDTTFSNLYGENDLGFDPDTGSQNQQENLTRVAISINDVFAEEESDTLPDYSEFYDIDRKSLLNPTSQNILSTFTSAANICLIKSAPNQEIDLEFGDGLYSQLGLRNTSQNIFIQYLSTQGAKANKIGVTGQTITSNDSFFVNSIDLTSNITFTLKGNIIGGSDYESLESIKINAPATFSSNDRCVTRRDYVSYLKSLTSPIVIKNAIAWGEQEEAANNNSNKIGKPIKKLFNVALYSCLASMYNLTSETHTVKMVDGTSVATSLSTSVLDDNFSPYSTMPSSYFNIIIKESVPDQLNYVTGLPSNSKILNVTNKLNTRTQMTTKNVYITPFIEEFDLVGNIYIKNFSNINFTQKTINNAIYEYLDKNADFDQPIYLSNLVDIIENNSNVVYANVYLQPYVSVSATPFYYNTSLSASPDDAIVDSNITSATYTLIGSETWTNIKETYIKNINSYLFTRTNFSFSDIRNVFNGTGINTKNYVNVNMNNITERNFYNDFGKTLYNDLLVLGDGITDCFANSVNFTNTLIKIRNTLDYMVKFSMLNQNTDLVNFSLANQICKIRVNTTYLYK